MSGLTVMELTDPRWADFVTKQPSATPFHHPDWGRLIANCYGFRAFAVATSDATGQIRAGLPVIEVRHLRGEPKWVTLPFTDYCPPLVSAPEEEARLVATLQHESAAAGVRRIEVRAPLAGTTPTSTAFRHVIALEADADRVSAGFNRTKRAQIRQAEKLGLTVRLGQEPADLTDVFYRIHVQTRRRLGVPVQPRRFFRMLWDYVISTGLGMVLVAEAAHQPVAAHVYMAWNRTVIEKYSASHQRAWPLRPNQLLLWHAIRTACEQGCRWLDLGRTDADDQGLRAFKRSWGAVEEPLVHGTLGARPQLTAAGNGMAGQLLASVIRHTPPVFCRAVGETLYRFTA